MSKQNDIVSKVLSTLAERGQSYDRNTERSMPKVIEAFNAITGKDLSAEEGWMLMMLLKLVRFSSARSKGVHEDSVVDLCAYGLLFAEEALVENTDKETVND